MPLEELSCIEGFDEDIGQELQNRARSFLEERDRAMEERRIELGVEDALAEMSDLTPTMLAALGEKGVKTLDDLGDLASDELLDIIGAESMGEEDANRVIMEARIAAGWFSEEDVAAMRAAAQAEADEAAAGSED